MSAISATRRGMSRKLLAQQSKVSERHLAQLETGEGKYFHLASPPGRFGAWRFA